MTIKELENELNIPRATVRFYEKENIKSFDENFYWNYVADEEEKGNKFIEILDGITRRFGGRTQYLQTKSGI